jgi:uncharacterized protein involved in cysteine biosynthesis
MFALEDKAAMLEPLVLGAEPRCPRCGIHLSSESSPLCAHCGVDPRSPEARKRLVAAGPLLIELFRGASYLPRGLYAIVRHPRLLRMAAIPLLVNVLAAIGLSTFVIPTLVAWLRWLTAPDTLTTWTGWLAVPRHAFEFLGWSVRVAPALVVPGIMAWLLSAPPLRQFFAAGGTFVSDATERAELGLATELEPSEVLQRERSVAAALLSSIGLSLLEAGAYLVLLPVALIPLAGTFVWLMGPRFVFAGVDASDPVLCRKLYRSAEKVALLRARRGRFLGLGIVSLAALGVPYVNGVVFPITSAAAALLYLELDRK